MSEPRSVPTQSDLERLITAGDELAKVFGKCPGWSTRRHKAIIAAWKNAKRDLDDPYGAHLRRVTKERKHG